MSVYKVPQDVEADDKLIGPFSPRQFVYLVIVALAIGLAYGLGTLLMPLAIIPLPLIILFGALALPLRKDQPMETYLSAMVSFFLKPRRRLWDPDGIDATIEITSPKITEFQLTKDFSQSEAQQRIGYLAKIVDTQGWAIRGTGAQLPNNSMMTDAYYSAQQAEDVMDANNATFRALTQKLEASDARRHQEAVNIMTGKIASTQFIAQPTLNSVDYFGNPSMPSQPIITQADISAVKSLDFNPYPEEMHQTIIRPISEQPNPPSQIAQQVAQPKSVIKPEPSTSEKPLTADIINLANNSDLSIETIAREAKRIRKRQNSSDEVFVSLR